MSYSQGWFIPASYLVGDLELLALADVGGLGDGGLKSVEGPVVQRLFAQHFVSKSSTSLTNRSCPSFFGSARSSKSS
jgi:hypothetical protein